MQRYNKDMEILSSSNTYSDTEEALLSHLNIRIAKGPVEPEGQVLIDNNTFVFAFAGSRYASGGDICLAYCWHNQPALYIGRGEEGPLNQIEHHVKE